MMMAGAFRHTPHPYNYNLINLYIVGLFSCVLFLPIQFVFRYYIVCHNIVLSTRKYALLCCTSLFVAVAYTCLHAWTFMPRGNLQQYAYIVDTPFWIDDTGKPPVFIAADIVSRPTAVRADFRREQGSNCITLQTEVKILASPLMSPQKNRSDF